MTDATHPIQHLSNHLHESKHGLSHLGIWKIDRPIYEAELKIQGMRQDTTETKHSVCLAIDKIFEGAQKRHFFRQACQKTRGRPLELLPVFAIAALYTPRWLL